MDTTGKEWEAGHTHTMSTSLQVSTQKCPRQAHSFLFGFSLLFSGRALSFSFLFSRNPFGRGLCWNHGVGMGKVLFSHLTVAVSTTTEEYLFFLCVPNCWCGLCVSELCSIKFAVSLLRTRVERERVVVLVAQHNAFFFWIDPREWSRPECVVLLCCYIHWHSIAFCALPSICSSSVAQTQLYPLPPARSSLALLPSPLYFTSSGCAVAARVMFAFTRTACVSLNCARPIRVMFGWICPLFHLSLVLSSRAHTRTLASTHTYTRIISCCIGPVFDVSALDLVVMLSAYICQAMLRLVDVCCLRVCPQHSNQLIRQCNKQCGVSLSLRSCALHAFYSTRVKRQDNCTSKGCI